MNKKKNIFLLTLILANLSSTIDLKANTYIVNNNGSISDFKVDTSKVEEDLKNFSTDILGDYSLDSTISTPSSSGDAVLNTLIDKNIISRDSKVSVNDSNLTVQKSEMSDLVSESDFLMSMSKAKEGVLLGGGLYLNNTSSTNLDKLTHGIEIYYNPNVYELYLYNLYRKGVISPDSIGSLNLKHDFDTLGNSDNPSQSGINIPDWYSNKNFTVDDRTQWGNSWILKKNSAEKVFEKEKPKYFVDENLSKIEAMKYIEKYIRIIDDEKDLTELESKIVSFKYGLNLVSDNEDVRKTLYFLTAKGILDFERPEEYQNLYDLLNKDFFYTLLLRLNNPNKRLDFSKIYLTDSEQFWMNKDFGKSTITFQNVDKPIDTPIDTYIGDPRGGETRLLSGFTMESHKYMGLREIEIERKYVSSSVYSIGLPGNSTPVAELKKSDTFISNTPIKVLEDSDLSSESGKIIVKFKITAVDEKTAVALLDGHTLISTEGGNGVIASGTQLDVVSKVTSETGEVVTLVSQSQLKTLPGIKVVHDKYIINTLTSTKALFLPDNNICLVGNEIFTYEDLMVISNDQMIYYNMNIINRLIGNAEILRLDPKTVYVSGGSTEFLLPITSFNTSASLGSISVQLFAGLPATATAPESDEYMIDITRNQSAMNTLIKKIDVEANGKKGKATVVLSFTYAIPDIMTGFGKELANEFQDVSNSSVMDLQKFITTPPVKGSLRDYWDTNIELNNALCNTLYGTVGVAYVNSGYLCPILDILADTKFKDEDKLEVEKSVLNEIQLSQEWLKKFTKYTVGEKYGNDIKTVFSEEVLPTSTNFDLNNSRVLSTHVGKSYSNNGIDAGVQYDSVYVIDKANHVWVKPDYDGRFMFTDNIEGTIPYSGGNAPKGITASTRSAETPKGKTSFTSGMVVVIEGKRWLYIGDNPETKRGIFINYIRSGNLNYALGDDFYKLSETATSEEVDMISKEGIMDYLKPTFDLGYVSVGDNFEMFTSPEVALQLLTESPLRTKYLSTYQAKKSILDIENGSYFVTKDGFQKVVKNEKDYHLDKSAVDIDDKLTYAIVEIEINPSQVVIGKKNKDGNYPLTAGTGSQVLRMGNIYSSGISSGVISSIVDEIQGSVSYSEIPSNSKVLIGDLTFIKNGKRLVSEPISSKLVNKDTLPPIMPPDKKKNEAEKSIAMSTLNGFSISYGAGLMKNATADVPNNGTGNVTPLSNYVTYAGIGNISTSIKKTFVNSNGWKLRLGEGLEEFDLSFDSVCTTFELDDNLKFQKLSSSDNTYSLLFYSNNNSEGYLNNVPWKLENLNYGIEATVKYDLTPLSFNPAMNKAEINDNIMQLFNVNVKKDIKGYVFLLSFSLCLFLMVMSLIIWSINRLDGTNSILIEMNKHFDFIALFTLGRWRHDTQITTGRLVRLQIYSLLVAVLLTYLYVYLN